MSAADHDAVSVMIVAAEASSALFAQRLLEHWKKEGRAVQAFGVGTNAMESCGFERLGKAEEMAVVGVTEILEHFGQLRGVFNRLVQEAAIRKPSLAIVLDYPDFNLMLSKRLHALGIPVVYYISPSVWAWRKGRANKIRKYCKKVLLLFPFEVPFYQERGVPYDFVGHPILDELDDKYFKHEYKKIHRQRYGLQEQEVVLGLMPGSRRGEIKQHLAIQLETAKILARKHENLRVILMVAPTLTKEHFQESIAELPFPIMLIQDEPFEMIHLADIVLAASGTATLMVGLLEKPMVIMYRMKYLTSLIARVVVRGVKFFGLVNLIMNREVVPERFQSDANPEHLAKLLERYITDPQHFQKVRAELAELKTMLGARGATARAAKAVEEFMGGR